MLTYEKGVLLFDSLFFNHYFLVINIAIVLFLSIVVYLIIQKKEERDVKSIIAGSFIVLILFGMNYKIESDLQKNKETFLKYEYHNNPNALSQIDSINKIFKREFFLIDGQLIQYKKDYGFDINFHQKENQNKKLNNIKIHIPMKYITRKTNFEKENTILKEILSDNKIYGYELFLLQNFITETSKKIPNKIKK